MYTYMGDKMRKQASQNKHMHMDELHIQTLGCC